MCAMKARESRHEPATIFLPVPAFEDQASYLLAGVSGTAPAHALLFITKTSRSVERPRLSHRIHGRQRRSNIRDRRVARWAEKLMNAKLSAVLLPASWVARHAATRHASDATSRLRRRLPARSLLLERVHRRIHLRAAPPRLTTAATSAGTSTAAATGTTAFATPPPHNNPVLWSIAASPALPPSAVVAGIV